jgi:uncharacterized membrane protein YbhN (UPF0104 family)
VHRRRGSRQYSPGHSASARQKRSGSGSGSSRRACKASTVAALRASHKLALLLLGNLATEVLFATALGLFARSFGYHVDLAELLVVDISVSLLASFIPIPGGIGVAEFGLTIGLAAPA